LILLLLSIPSAAQYDGIYTADEDGRFADAAQFAAIENHIRTMEACVKTLQELGNVEFTNTHFKRGQPNKRSAFFARMVTMKEEAASSVQRILLDYFLVNRLKYWDITKRTPAGYASQEYKDYTRMLELIHYALSYVFWARESTIEEKPEMVRYYIQEFRRIYESDRVRENLLWKPSERQWTTKPMH
jgi:hypothetical protein